MKKYLLALLLTGLIYPMILPGQGFLTDSCFMSTTPGTSFSPSADLVSFNADLLDWTGTNWTGGWPLANLTIPPPSGQKNCRAIFIGDGVVWTTGGEAFAIRLVQGLIPGNAYKILFTYISHGMGSNGSFAPKVYSNSMASTTGATLIGSLPAVGYSWASNPMVFTADSTQAGHNWIIVGTETGISSGLISSMCPECSAIMGIEGLPALSCTISPNPCHSVLNVSLGYPGNHQLSVKLQNLYGQTFWSIEELTSGNTGNYEIDMGALPSGVYLLRVFSGNERIIRKIVKD